VKETGENHQPVTSPWQTLSHNVVLNSGYILEILDNNISI
jgi:hypothetical protein